MRFPRFIIGLTAGIALSAQAANIDEYINQLPAGANLAFMAQKGRRIDAGNRLSQASKWRSRPVRKKVITALAALQLGPDFRFTTTLETKGSLDGGVLKGDLIARLRRRSDAQTAGYSQYGGDAEKAGVRRIEGNVLIDTSVFASHDKSAGLAVERPDAVLQRPAGGRNCRP